MDTLAALPDNIFDGLCIALIVIVGALVVVLVAGLTDRWRP